LASAPSNSATSAAGRLSTGSPKSRIGYVAMCESYRPEPPVPAGWGALTP
jgi:hypothetical protein